MPLATWFIVRLFGPHRPDLDSISACVSRSVYAYLPAADTRILLILALSVVTISEYENFRRIIALSVVPVVLATVLYVVHLFAPNNPVAQQKALLLGFYAWLLLGVIHSIRVLCEWFVTRKSTT